MNELHRDLIITHLTFLCRMYPAIWKKPINIFIEANLSQDLAAYLEHAIRNYYMQMSRTMGQVPVPKFVRQYDSCGRLLPGVLTKHKANLVSYFKRTLDNGQLYMADTISTVSKVIEKQFESNTLVNPQRENASEMITTVLQQLHDFRCFHRGNTLVYSGKKRNDAMDDMAMALILCVAWMRLPENMYLLV